MLFRLVIREATSHPEWTGPATGLNTLVRVRTGGMQHCPAGHPQRSTCPTTAPTSDGGRIAARAVISSGVTAALCYNDLLAIGLMQELQAAGIKIPDDFSVIGCVNIFGSDFTTAALTTIASPFSESGTAALNLLLTALPREEQADTPASTQELRTTLVVRGSSGLC